MDVDRRQFVAWIGGGTVAAAGAVYAFLNSRDRSPSVDVTVEPFQESPPRGSDLVIARRATLPKAHALTLESVVGAIYPSDESGPGSLDVGAFEYVLDQLRRRDMQPARRVLIRGATQTNRLSAAKFANSFATLEANQKHDIVRAMYGGEGGRGGFDPREFVQFMVALTLEGMFAHPVYGGNRDGTGWKLIGYEGACRDPSLKAPL